MSKAIFKVAPADHYKRKVRVSVPGDFGRHSIVEITVHFKRLTHTELRELFKLIQKQNTEIKAATENGDEITDDQDAGHLRNNILGWGEDVKGPDDQPVPFTADNLDAMLDITAYRRALMKAFLEDLSDPESKNRKN
jgi:hypothetical protein